MNETLEIIQSEFAQASFETFEMVLISMIAAAILGTILGLVLHLASNPIFYKNRVVNGITGTIIKLSAALAPFRHRPVSALDFYATCCFVIFAQMPCSDLQKSLACSRFYDEHHNWRLNSNWRRYCQF